MAVVATKGESNRFKLVLQSLWSRIFYSNILLVWKLSAFYDEWTARGMTWDKLARTGFSKKLGEL
jgi:hypothetical protein